MGEVYKARDTRLGRDVAIKVLPSSFAEEPERLARFRREAQILASLNHPNIAAIYGLEESDGRVALAMEFVPGEDLAERLRKGPIPFEEALAIARQIAEALEEAHEKGIVHRDLKPANVKLTPDGKVKVLDFGLAKALEGDSPASEPSGLTRSPTRSRQMTEAGMILGTAAYMSPEQARGKAVDKKTDIWAFGVVLFEMLTGKQLFEGETASDVLAAVLTRQPDWAVLPPAAQGHVRALLHRCLERNPKQRLHDIADARIELAEEETALPTMPRDAPARRATAWLPWSVALLSIAASVFWAVLGGRSREDASRPLKLAVLPPSGLASSGHIDLSADGRQIVFTAAGTDGRPRLYVRSLDSLEARPLPGTEGADAPFFSPNGLSIGFFADKKLKRVDLAGGPARELAEAPEHRGGSWGSKDIIVFAPEGGGPIFKVPASGGAAVPVMKLDAAAQEVSHRWPRFLPDGKRFLFMSRKPKPPSHLAIEVGSVDGGARTRLVDSSSGGAFARGRLYFVRETTLLAQALDSRTLSLSGDPVPVAEDVWRNPITDGLTAFSVASDGTVAYRLGGVARSQLTWLDRKGEQLGTVGSPATFGDVDLSPDGSRLLVDVVDLARDMSGLFVLDAATGMTTRVSFGTGNQAGGRYSPDGRSIVFSWDARGAFDLYR
jgi:serine/threonine protein kinase